MVRHEWLNPYIIKSIEARHFATQWIKTTATTARTIDIVGITPVMKLERAA
jgi:hypothetical protein